MPLRKKKNTHIRTIAIWAVVIIILALMIISFSPVQSMTEIVLYPS